MVAWVFTGICISAQVCIFAGGVFFFLFVVTWFGLLFLNVNAVKKDLFFTSLKRKETQNGSFVISLCVISIQHVWNTLPSSILPFGLVFKL